MMMMKIVNAVVMLIMIRASVMIVIAYRDTEGCFCRCFRVRPSALPITAVSSLTSYFDRSVSSGRSFRHC